MKPQAYIIILGRLTTLIAHAAGNAGYLAHTIYTHSNIFVYNVY